MDFMKIQHRYLYDFVLYSSNWLPWFLYVVLQLISKCFTEIQLQSSDYEQNKTQYLQSVTY